MALNLSDVRQRNDLPVRDLFFSPGDCAEPIDARYQDRIGGTGPSRPAPQFFESRSILGLDVQTGIRDSVIKTLRERLNARSRTLLAFANTNLMNSYVRGELEFLNGPEWLVLNDGVGLDVASRILHGSMFPDNLNGSDLVPALLKALRPTTRIYLHGSVPECVKKVAHILARDYSVKVCGYSDGYNADKKSVLRNIKAVNPDVVLVALGNPKQEQWIESVADEVDVPLMIGVGALFDYIGGRRTRAPAIFRRMRLEWLFRLFTEPKRLFKRYTWDVAKLIVRIVRHKFGARSRLTA